MQLLVEESRRVYDKFKWKLEKSDINKFNPNDFRLLDWINYLYKNNELKEYIDEIINIGDKMSSLIREKGALIEGGITDTYITYQGHLSILKAEKEGSSKIVNKQESQKFGYYPRLLNREICEGYKTIIQYLRTYLEAGDKLIFKILKQKSFDLNTFKERQQLLQSLRYYEKYKDKYIEKFDDYDLTPLINLFINEIKKSVDESRKVFNSEEIKILDAGCGTGRDVKYFINEGFKITAFDASPAMVFETKRKIANLKAQDIKSANFSNCIEMTFEEVNYKREFDGIWAAASLLHIHPKKIDYILKVLVDALKPGGIMFFSLKYGKGSEKIGYRYFYYYTENYINKIIRNIEGIKKLGFKVLTQHPPIFQRPRKVFQNPILSVVDH